MAETVTYGSRAGRWVLLATILASGISQLDATVVNVALPRIGKDLHIGLKPAMDRQRVRPDAVGSAVARRLARRPLRPPPDLCPRRPLVHRRVPRVRARPNGCLPDRHARGAGRRGRDADSGLTRDPAGRVRTR